MLEWLVQNTLAAAVLAVVVLIACRLHRFRPAIEHLLWLVVLLKLLTPAGIAWPWLPLDFSAHFPAPAHRVESGERDDLKMSSSTIEMPAAEGMSPGSPREDTDSMSAEWSRE